MPTVKHLGILVLAVCVLAAWPGSARVAGAATPTPLGARVGIGAGSLVLWESDFERRAELDRIAATGATWFAMDIDWASAQPKRGVYDWSVTDRVVREARAVGLKIIGIIAYSPKWARGPTCPAGTSHCLPANTADYAAFARQAAARYGNYSAKAGLRGSITTWQVWNEPNHYPFVQPTVNVAAYTQMLKQTYTQIKTVDIFATILAGGTSPAPDDPSIRDVSPITFLKGIYANGGQYSFSGFAHHPYSFPCDPLTTAHWNAFYQTQGLYFTMVMNGDASKKIWGTEVGSPTGSNMGNCTSGAAGSVSEAVQAQFVRSYIYGWTQKYGSFTGPLIFFQIRDNGTNRGLTDDNFGLLRRNFTMKPSYLILTQLLH